MYEIETGLAIPGSVPKGGRLNAHILVGTPGTVQDFLRRKVIDTTHLKILVMDEADFLLDQQGLGDQAIRVKRAMASDVQVLLFSATFSDKVEKPIKFLYRECLMLTVRVTDTQLR
jgi:ATP-dependent RNA helicase DDX19/DBP5